MKVYIVILNGLIREVFDNKDAAHELAATLVDCHVEAHKVYSNHVQSPSN